MKLPKYAIKLVVILSFLMIPLLSSNLVFAHPTIPQQSATSQQVTNGVRNTTTNETFNTIQDAIYDPETLDGHTLTVAPGIYNESVYITKQLTILGANAGVNPNTSGRIPSDPVTESIIRPPIAGYAFVNGSGDIDEFGGPAVLYPLANNIIIDGFTIDGDAPSTIDPNGFVLLDGERVDASYGVFGGGNNITIQNNIFTNISGAGVWLFLPGYGLVTQNRFINLDAPRGLGGLTTDNFYADVTNNVVDEVTTGWQTDRMTLANTNPANPRILIANNDFTVNNMGIFINRHSGASPDYTISNNIIRSDTRTSGNLRGMQIFAIQNTVYIDFNNNIVQGTPAVPFDIGVSVWNVPTTNFVTITNLLVDYAVIGVNMQDCNRQFGQADPISNLIINNAEIRNTSNVGLRVIDSFFAGRPTARTNDNQACSQSGASGAGLPSASVTMVASDINFNNNAGLAAIHITTDPLDPQGALNDPQLIISDSTITGGTTTQQILLDGNGRIELISSFLNGNNNNIIGMTVNSPNNFFAIETSHIYNHRPNNGVVINQTGSDIRINNSCLYNNAFGVQNNSGVLIDATNNWWGNVTGPSTTGVDAFRDAVSANVDFTGFLTSQPTVAGVLCPVFNQPPATTPEPTPATPPSGLTPPQLGVTQLPATGETPLWAVYLRQILQWMGFPLP